MCLFETSYFKSSLNPTHRFSVDVKEARRAIGVSSLTICYKCRPIILFISFSRCPQSPWPNKSPILLLYKDRVVQNKVLAFYNGFTGRTSYSTNKY